MKKLNSVNDLNLMLVFLRCGVLGILMMWIIPILFKPVMINKQFFVGYWQGEKYLDYWNANSSKFDHPEPNFVVMAGIAEFWSTLTTIPFAGVMLLATAIHQDYDVKLGILYLHVVLMYIGAFLSHLTLIPALFTLTVSGVVANSLVAYFWWSHRLGGIFARYRQILAWSGLVMGLFVAVNAILILQELPSLSPIGGFITLALVQPPFVFLGLCSALWLLSQDRSSEGLRLLTIGGAVLMLAMAISAIETFVDPLLVNNIPILHITIHVLEQIGIYLYGVGTAALHYSDPVNRRRFQILSRGGVPRLLFISWPPGSSLPRKTDSLEDADSFDPNAFDLLDRRPREDPHAWNARYLRSSGVTLCPVRYERDCYAVFQSEAVRAILADDETYASNPFPDDRPIGLSTLAEPQHSVQRRILAPHFAKRQLLKQKACFKRVINGLTEQFLAQPGGGDLVRHWGYRIAMASALISLGVRDEERYLLNHPFLDQLIQYSIDMVSLVAPVGGMGPPAGWTLSQAGQVVKNLILATPATLALLQQVGIRCAWSLLRPDLNLRETGQSPRNGVASCPELLPSVPKYFRLLDDLWRVHAIIDNHRDSAFYGLDAAQQAGKISRADGLLLIVQSLVGMTTANALVNAVDRILQDDKLHSQLASDPSRLPSFVQACLCHDAPLQRLPRRVTRPTQLLGVDLPKNASLLLMIGACNQAENGEYADDLSTCPRKHPQIFTFGLGRHQCLGESLVRLEMRWALKSWLKKTNHHQILSTPGPRLHNIDVGNFGFIHYHFQLI